MVPRRILKITFLILGLVCLLLVPFRQLSLKFANKYTNLTPITSVDSSRLKAFTDLINKTGNQTGIDFDLLMSILTGKSSKNGYQTGVNIEPQIPTITGKSTDHDGEHRQPPLTGKSREIGNQTDQIINHEKLAITGKSSETGYQTKIDIGRLENGVRSVVQNISKGLDQESIIRGQSVVEGFKQVLPKKGRHNVIVWGQAIISTFLWRHILGGQVKNPDTISPNYGSVTHGNTTFRLYNGVKPLPPSVEATAEYMIVVLKESAMGRKWFTYNMDRKFRHLKKLALVVLGSEQCNNYWLHKHMRHTGGGRVDIMFLVYDSPEIDDTVFYQWPLGVSAHRGFPVTNVSMESLHQKRKYLCNFMGSLATSATRVQLLNIIKQIKLPIYTRVRRKWIGHEDNESMQQYINVLSNSDLTLCPVGHNTECFRLYEAMAFGSVPVVHDIMTKGQCGHSKISNVYPLRLLKDFHAPIMYVKSWKELPNILQREQNLTLEEKVERRKEIVTWYRDFKLKIRDRFLNVLQQKFFQENGS